MNDSATSRGRVVEFDEAIGLGTIESDGGTEHRFHCIEIADGSRTIVVGTPVMFAVVPKLGRWEAASIRSVA